MIETTRGMIGDLIARGEQIQETALSKDDHGWGQMSRISTDSSFREGQPHRLNLVPAFAEEKHPGYPAWTVPESRSSLPHPRPCFTRIFRTHQ
jgi:hypothetical protein